MSNTATLIFAGDDRSLSKTLNSVDKATSGTSSKVEKLGKVGRAVALGGFALLAATAKVGWDSMKDGQAVSAQTEAVLKSTGRAAGVTKGHVEDLAMAIRKKTGLDDAAIQSGQNLLLTFTNIKDAAGKGNDVFTQTTKVMADMSVAMKQDTRTSAMQLGKALNDPVKGMTALGKVGVTFTDSQKAAAKAMVAAGDTTGAQRIILAELNKEFGGSAEKAGTLLPQRLAVARMAFEDIAESVLGMVMPALTFLADHLGTVAAFLQANQGVTLLVVGAVTVLAGAVWAVNAASKAFAATQAAVNTVLAMNPLVLVTLLIVALVAAVVIAYRRSETFRSIVQGAFNAVRNTVASVVGAVSGFLAAVGDRFRAVGNAAQSLYLQVRGWLQRAVDWVRGMPGRIAGAAAGMWDGISNAFRNMLNRIISMWNRIGIPGFKIPIPGAPDINVPGISVPDIPYLANGGIVTRPTLAVVGERGPEAVIPLSGGRGMGGGIVVNIYDRTTAGWSPETRRRMAEELAPELRRRLAVA